VVSSISCIEPARKFADKVSLQASHDWDWRVFLHYLGHMVETLSQWTPGRVRFVMAASVFASRSRPDEQGCKWRCET
jgi:hypothetical protein